jgi:AraC-like DNA-binding protein
MIAALPVPATYTRVILQATPPAGRAALLAGTGLREEALGSSDSIRADQQLQVVRNAMNQQAKPDWGLALGQQLNINSHGPLGFAALSAPTLGESLETLAAFGRIRAPYLLFSSSRSGDRYHLFIEPAMELGDVGLVLDEAVLQVVLSLVNVVLGSVAPGMGILLAHPAPAHAGYYARYFAVPCEFDQARSGIELPASLCQVPCPLRDEQSYVTSLARCRTALAAILDPADVVTRARNLLAGHFDQLAAGTRPGATPQLEDLASTLHMSPRTLIRQLAAKGSGYRELLENAQRNTACKLLGDARYSVAEIGDLLGYSDAANFGRAFRRWFGMAPGQYRRQSGR